MRRLNLLLVTRVMGFLSLVVTAFLLPSLLLALTEGNRRVVEAFVNTLAWSGGIGLVFAFVVKERKSWLGPREGFLLVTFGWVWMSVLGALPYVFSGMIPSFTDAFFESMSGFTTTGASILTDVEVMPRSLLLWRSQTHWLGGMGVIALTVAVLPALGVSGMNLLRAETPGHDVDKVTPRLNETAKVLWLIYVGLTLVMVPLLMLGGMDLFDAVNHAFATMATGGFSTKNASLAYWDAPFIHWVITVFTVMAGVNFVVYWRLVARKATGLSRNSELRTYLGIFVGASVVLAAALFFHRVTPDLEASVRIAAFQISTIMTTTGFGIGDYNLWPPVAQAAILLVMFVGGSTGSTSGGIKVLRVVGMAKLAMGEARRMLDPRGVFQVRINGAPVRKDLLYPIAAFVFTYLVIAVVSTVVVSAGGVDLITSFSAVLATLGNIGPGFGLVGPVNNYAFLPDLTKWYLSFLMLLGRLELWTVLVLFLPRLWRR